MDLSIDFEEIEKVKAEVWLDGRVEIKLMGKHGFDEVTLRGFADEEESKQEVIAKLKELLAASARVLGYLDPEGEVGLVEIECRYCDGLSDYPVVAQDLFYEARKEAENVAEREKEAEA